MAFTSAESFKVRHYLGYPQVYRQSNPRLESAITLVGEDVDAVAAVQGLIVSIENVLTAIGSAGINAAGVKSLDQGALEFFGGGSSGVTKTAGLNSIGKQYVAQLSGIFGVPIATNIFGTVGYEGDAWKLGAGNSSWMGLAGLG
jgi:hypothetical protein